MYCSKCGNEMPDGSKFCTECGQKVAAPARSGAAATTVISDEATTVISDTTNVVAPAATTGVVSGMDNAFKPKETFNPGQTAQMPYTAGVQPAAANVNAAPVQNSSSKKIVIIVVSVVVVLLLAGGIAAAVLLGNKAPQSYKLTFETEGGSTIAAETVEDGEAITSPADPSKEGYTFDGWYANDSYTQPITFPLNIEQDVTIYAKWTKKVDETDKTAPAETKPNDSAEVAQLKSYYRQLAAVSDELHTFTVKEFNAHIYHSEAKHSEGASKLSNIANDLYKLKNSSGNWTVADVVVTEHGDAQTSLIEASNLVEDRINCLANFYHEYFMLDKPTKKDIDAISKNTLGDSEADYEKTVDLLSAANTSLN